MSAIWGMINKQQKIQQETAKKMTESMQTFKIDRYQQILQENMCLAAGQQYFRNPYGKDDILIHLEESEEYFLADCVLSNRKELLHMLEAEGRAKLSDCGDGILACQAYLVWGEAFVERLRGSFAFAIYRLPTQEVLLYADHFARRYLSYYVDDQTVCFATVYQPLLAVLTKQQCQINREWIALAYSDCTADTIKLHGDTVYENICHVEPGQFVRIRVGEKTVEKHCYWNPIRKKKDPAKKRKKTDAEYQEDFLSTFEKAVTDLLDIDGEVGIMLSGGLDSSSVAAFAARHLAEKGNSLYSYTSVPLKEYVVTDNPLEIENEKDYILAQQKMYPNLYPQFICAEGDHCFTDLKAHVNCYREPVKPILNMVNLHAILSKAAEDGCRIMLSGQNGNATISYGSILTYVHQKIARFHWRQAYLGMKDFCRLYRLPRKRFVKIYLTTLWKEKFQKYRLGEDCFLQETDRKTYQVEKTERKIMKSRGNGYMDSKRQRQGFGFMPLVYQHMGFFDTYNSLRYGILSVDPTLSKEMVELCLSMPIDCFVSKGKERRAVRDYMKGYVPDLILDNYGKRGVQAADYAFRVNCNWDDIREEVMRLLSNPRLMEYVDEEKVEQLRKEIRKKEYHLDKQVVAEMTVLSSLSAFLETV